MRFSGAFLLERVYRNYLSFVFVGAFRRYVFIKATKEERVRGLASSRSIVMFDLYGYCWREEMLLWVLKRGRRGRR